MKKSITKFSIIFPIVLILLLVTSLAIPCASTQGIALVLNLPQCWGVFVGVGEYLNIPTSYTVWRDDAQGLYDQISPVWGTSHTQLLLDSDATKSGIMASISWLASHVNTGDTALFFISALGESPSYLWTYDTVSGSAATYINPIELNNAISAIHAGKIIVILQGWGSGSFETALAGNNRVIIMSSDVGEPAWISTLYNRSFFGNYLIKAFENFDDADANHDYELSAEEVFQYAAPLTTDANSSQHPVLNDQYSGDLPLIAKFVFNTNISLPSSSTIVTIDGSNHVSIPPPFYWVPGHYHSVAVPAEIIGSTGTRYSFTNWNGGDTALTKSVTSGALTANFNKEFHLIINSAYDTPTGDGWYVDGTTASFSVTASVETSNTKHNFTGWSGDFTGTAAAGTMIMKAPKTITANWHSQYLVTINSDYGTPIGPGWYDEGTTANIAVEPTQGIIIRHIFDSWSGDLTSTTASTSIVMSAPKVITANWHADYMQLYIVIGAVVLILLIIIIVVLLARRKGGTPRVPPTTTTYTPPTYSPPPPTAGPPSAPPPPPPAPR